MLERYQPAGPILVVIALGIAQVQHRWIGVYLWICGVTERWM